MDTKTLVTQINVNIAVKDIEPSLAFWQAVGFQITDSVPVDGPEGSGPLGFAIISNGQQQFMMQTVESIEGDMQSFKGKDLLSSPVLLFIVVANIDAIDEVLQDFDQAFPRRETFYGATEIGYYTPDGTQVTFAEFKEG
ncbi:hypothetical protein QGN29_05530 [Temperatibacter marinus]|uniref:Glyoxalase/fosfomycin resistance/dioxygenase domain-containing protein n=1 Tax=Temperatibacter marinus TaxID=1456591 RepID=A0AA52HAD0_9PROT|nr:VOC family protein [Temperatibacter marinus]WND03834.1 hypothetical protein QGN29_05530 [Temperatibacter marinus]